MAAKARSKTATDLVASSASSDALEFRKTNEAIGLRIREGRLSLLSRKLYNVMVYHAQQMKEPGLNAPIDTEAAKKYFWLPLAEVARDAAYDSKDTELLKQHVEEFQNIKIHMEDDRQWTSERLVSSVKLVNPAGLNKKGGAVWFGFAFPPEVFELVMNPGTYTKLSIYYQGLLRSGPALALYEICRRYATNPSRLTGIEPYEYWYAALTGNPMREDPPPYKYFKRDVIKPAVAEINAATDIDVALIEHKQGRRVASLQFAVELKRQPSFELPMPPVIDGELIARLMKLGFTRQEACDLAAEHPEEKLRASLEVVEARLAARNSPSLDSPAAYFRWSLKQGPGVAKALAPPVARPPAARRQGSSLMERFTAARAREAFAIYRELDEAERSGVAERFKASAHAKGVRTDRGIETQSARTALGMWYARELWGEPTAEALSNFAEQLLAPEQPG